MSEIRKLLQTEIDKFVDISCNAYPSFNLHSKEEKEKLIKNYSHINNEIDNENFYGLFRDNELLGGMLLHDFKLNYRGTMIESGGVGSVAVDLLHKKEKVAKELIEYFLQHYRNKGVNLTVLYPFRISFYKDMGFGYGTKMNEYKIKPAALRKSELKKNVFYLNEEDKESIRNCYNKYVSNTHGMIEMGKYEYDNLLKNPKLKVLGYKKNGILEGYVQYSFKTDNENFLINDIVIHRFIYNTRDALLGILGFFQSQLDQIRYIVLRTQDESFHHLLSDPTNASNHIIPHVYHESNVQGIGFMYRITNIEGFFNDIKHHNFNKAIVTIKLSVSDNFMKENNKELVIKFIDGNPVIINDSNYDVEIKMDIAEFSSLIMGVIDFKTLYNYSLADISNKVYLDIINNLFKTDVKPICMTGF